MAIDNPEVQTKAETLKQINNQITMANAELDRIIGLHQDNTRNIETQAKTLAENEVAIGKQVVIKERLDKDVTELKEEKEKLEDDISTKKEEVNKELLNLSQEKEAIEKASTQVNKETEALEKRIKDQDKKESDFYKEVDSFTAYKEKILKAINDK